MRIGVIYPQTEFVADPVQIRDFVQAIEGMGFSHILAYEHVLGIKPKDPANWRGPYTYKDAFMEPLVLFSFMAGVTTTLGFCTGILVLPQRQTALVAKQAACLEILCGGRLRIGVGVGWNSLEFEGMNQDFHDRGRRVDEQIELLKALWQNPVIDFKGEWHSIEQAGINPLPPHGSIPLWFGGQDDRVLRRIARYGEGWIPPGKNADDILPGLETLKRYFKEERRPVSELGVEGRIRYEDGNLERLARSVEEWDQVGATHVSINIMNCGFAEPGQHLEALRRFASYLRLEKK